MYEYKEQMFQAVRCFGQLGVSDSWVFRAVGRFRQLGISGSWAFSEVFPVFVPFLPDKMGCKASILPGTGRFLEYFDDLYPFLQFYIPGFKLKRVQITRKKS